MKQGPLACNAFRSTSAKSSRHSARTAPQPDLGAGRQKLPEDIAAVEAQWRNMSHAASRYSIIAQEELQTQCDGNVRAFYQEWGRRVGRWPHDADAPRELTVVADGGQRAHG